MMPPAQKKIPTESKEAPTRQEEDSPTAIEPEKTISETPTIEPEQEITGEEIVTTPEEEKIEIQNNIFSSEEFLLRLEKSGIKSTLIPLLKTAQMRLDGNTLEIQTTGFCKSKCVEAPYYQILEKVANSFNAEKINIMVPNEIQPETSPAEESVEDVARALFE